MKKSKLLRITARETLEDVRLKRAAVEAEFKYRHNGPFSLKEIRRYLTLYVKALRRDRIFLRATEKQIPMPLRIHAELLPFRNFNNSYCYICLKNYFCQNCNKKILKFEGYGIEFCPYCGQKFWWAKN